ncbi:uncharacterized protein METZ01_LOCUS357621 [marine metagenome]|uniref:Uncharacterized protein n=1 Tax=marine metagenome TaxID=408172 RepID=A0A382S6E7_9ZZZZ
MVSGYTPSDRKNTITVTQANSGTALVKAEKNLSRGVNGA